MSFGVTKENDITIIDVEGQLIVGNRQELKQKVLQELESGERKFLIDFTLGHVLLFHWLAPGILRRSGIDHERGRPVTDRLLGRIEKAGLRKGNVGSDLQ